MDISSCTETKLRVHHTVASIEDLSAGPSHSVPGLAIAQSNQGAETSIHSTAQSTLRTYEHFRNFQYERDFQRVPIVKRMMYSKSMSNGIKASDCDIIHNHGLWTMPNIYGSRSAATSKAKLVLAPRGMLSNVALGFSPLKKKAFGLLYQNLMLSRVDMFHATCEKEYEEIRAFGLTQPVAIVPNGIYIPTISKNNYSSLKSKTILSLGRIHPKKNLDMLIRAWAKLELLHPNWTLHIVGPSERGYDKELRAIVENLGLLRVKIEGPVTGDEKTVLLASSELFALPTKSENFAMTVAESLAVGTPVISSKGAPWEGLLSNQCGWWVEGEQSVFRDTLNLAMEMSNSERQKMGKRGREWMESEFTWNGVACKMIQAYQWLTQGERPPAHVRID